MSNNKWLESLPAEARKVYLSKLNEKKRERYATDEKFRRRVYKKDNAYLKYQAKREAVIEYLGGRCSDQDCTSFNADGSRGCKDTRCLQIDHVMGDGALCRRVKGAEGSRLLDTVLKTVPGEIYQLLCANCNWIKRAVNRELPQARMTDDSFVFIDHRKLRQKDELGRFAAVAGV